MSSLPFHMTTLPLPCITVSTPRRHTRIYYFDVTKHVLSSRYFYRNSDSPYHVTSAHHCIYSCIIIVLSDISCINLQFIARHLRRILLRGFRYKTNLRVTWKKLQINKSIIGFTLNFLLSIVSKSTLKYHSYSQRYDALYWSMPISKSKLQYLFNV